jgi:hypothetical protein
MAHFENPNAVLVTAPQAARKQNSWLTLLVKIYK